MVYDTSPNFARVPSLVPALIVRTIHVYARPYLNLVDTLGATLLMFAAHDGHAKVVRRQAELGSDAGMRDSRGRTSLHHGAEGVSALRNSPRPPDTSHRLPRNVAGSLGIPIGSRKLAA